MWYGVVISVVTLFHYTHADLCVTCQCENEKLFCDKMGLETHFNDSEWNGTAQTEVYFDNNKIVHLKAFPELSLLKLSLSHNAIARIDESAFRLLANLTELDLSHNHLTSDQLMPNIFRGSYAPEAYEPLRALRVLRLGSNALHTLDSDIFEHLPNLESLSLDSNPFKVIDRPTAIAITSLPYLKVLDLSSMALKTIPENLFHTPRFLEILNISSNQFTSVPSGLADTHSLRQLTMNDNPIRVIDQFPSLTSLHTLHLSWMPKLTHVTQYALSNLTSLQEVHLCHNPQLTMIDGTAFSQPSIGNEEDELRPPITKLYLSYNKLGYLHTHLLSRWDRLEVLDLQNNPWVCDCQNQWILSDLVPAMVKNNLPLTGIVCHEPVEMRGQTLLELEQRSYHMRCLDKYGHQPEKDALLLVGVLLGLLLAIPISLVVFTIYRRRLRAPTNYSRAFYKPADSIHEFTTA